MKKVIEKIKYPKFVLLSLTIFIAIIIFSYTHIFLPLFNFLLSLGYFGIFLTGIFYSYSFTAIPATAVLLVLAEKENIILTAFVAGFGAVIGDLLIFKFIRHSFDDELKLFAKEKVIIYIKGKAHRVLKKYFMILTGFIIIASPLPDEIGVFLIAEFTSITTKLFSLIAFILDTCGILVILIIGQSI